MNERLSKKEAGEIANIIAREFGLQNPVKIKMTEDGEWGIFRSLKKKFLFFRWFKYHQNCFVHSKHLEDLIEEFPPSLEREKLRVDPRWKVADDLRNRYFDKLLSEKLKL